MTGVRAAAAGVIAALASAACTPAGADLPVYDGSRAGPTAATPGPTQASATPGAAPAADTAAVVTGRILADGPRERAAADAWVRYWRARIEAFHRVDAGSPALADVATGPALRSVRRGVADLRASGSHTVGTLTINVRAVTVAGDRATVASCLTNRTLDVDVRGRPVESLVPAYGVRGTAVADGSSWRVSAVEVRTSGRCG